MKVLVSAMEAEEAGWAASRKVDQAALAGAQLQGRARTATQFRVEKKGVFGRCLEAVRVQKNLAKQKLTGS